MIITSFYSECFRNLKNMQFEPCDKINVIYGENGQGKTNMIEGIWLFTGFKSFRTKRNGELIPYDSEFYKISMDYYAENRLQNLLIQSDKTKQTVFRNQVKMISTRSIIGAFFSVVFSPAHLSLVKDGPDEKRKFLDIAISQLKPSYARTLSRYYKVVKQRNAFLKSCENDVMHTDMLDCWDESIAELGAKITYERVQYTEKLKQYIYDIYTGLSGGREVIEISYMQNGRETCSSENEMKEALSLALKKSIESDIRNKTTSKGPHRDDFEILLDEKNIKNFGSQGQQRSAALALKLGEAKIIEAFQEEKPVILLDDVMSELDVNRQNYILNKLGESQVFITCCEPTQVMRLNSGKSFCVKNGKIVKEEI